MDYTKEKLLLKLCLGASPGQDFIEKTAPFLNDNNLNWNFIARHAQEQDIAPLLYYRLSFQREKLPADFLSTLENSYKETKKNNLILYKEFKDIAGIFNDNNIECLPLKGIELANSVYPDIGLRPMVDIDILIKKKDLIRIEKALLDLNYFMYPNYVKILDKPASPYLNAIVCRKLSSPFISLHLHWHIFNYTFYPGYGYISDLNIDDIWREAKPDETGGIKVSKMAPHHLLLHLSEHNIKHGLSNILHFTDIDTFLNHYYDVINWEKIIRSAFEYNLSRPLYYNLYLVSHICGTKIQKDILSKLKPENIGSFENKFINSALKGGPAGNLSYFVFLAMNKKFRKKARFIYRTLFPHPEYIFLLQDIYGTSSRFKYNLLHLYKIYRNITTLL